MTSDDVPKLATYLLRTCGSTPDIETVVGDLAERDYLSRSSVWYWRQVLATIVVLAIKDIRNHKLLTIRALILGWAVVDVAVGPFHLLMNQYYTFPRIHRIFSTPRDFLDVDRQYWIFVVAGLTLTMVANAAIGVLSGWLVAKYHRAAGKAPILLLAASVTVVSLILLPGLFSRRSGDCLVDITCRSVVLLLPWGTLLIWASIVVSILYGGLLLPRWYHADNV